MDWSGLIALVWIALDWNGWNDWLDWIERIGLDCIALIGLPRNDWIKFDWIGLHCVDWISSVDRIDGVGWIALD